MMNKKRLMAILAAGVLTATSFNPAMIKAESVSAEEAGMRQYQQTKQAQW